MSILKQEQFGNLGVGKKEQLSQLEGIFQANNQAGRIQLNSRNNYSNNKKIGAKQKRFDKKCKKSKLKDNKPIFLSKKDIYLFIILKIMNALNLLNLSTQSINYLQIHNSVFSQKHPIF
ncbi:hypothetical protein ABPG74_006236 [Tetrahymena malaccensis]